MEGNEKLDAYEMEQRVFEDMMMKSIGDLALHELVDLVEYLNRPTPIPPCRVCGGELHATSMGGDEPTVYHCSTEAADFLRTGGGGFGSEAFEHYERSSFCDRKHTDPWAYELAKRMTKAIQINTATERTK